MASARAAMCLVITGVLNFSSVSAPSRPFALVANGRLCQALNCSIWVQVIHAGTTAQFAPPAFSFLATAKLSGQVLGGFSGSSPALAKASLFQYTIAVELLNGIDSILP